MKLFRPILGGLSRSMFIWILAGSAFGRQIPVQMEFLVGPGQCASPAGLSPDCPPWDKNLRTLREEGKPVVPVRVSRVILELNEELVGVTVEAEGVEKFDYDFMIAGEQKPIGLPDYHRANVVFKSTASAFSRNWIGVPRVSKFRGYSIVETSVYPVRAIGPGRAAAAKVLRLVVETRKTYENNDMLRPAKRDVKELQSFDADHYGSYSKPRIIPPGEEAGYLIIGPKDFIAGGADSPLSALIKEKEERGLRVYLADVETVSPSKKPKEIRDYIRAQYKSSGVDYVLLVGDKERIPWKYIQTGVDGESDPVPSDQYYACLDGEFDSVSNIDWACEVAVGRVGAKSRGDVANWVAKTLRFQELAASHHTGSVLNYGEKLDGQTLAGRVLDFLVTGTSNAPQTA